jgi:hypothetical protein
VYHHAWPSLNYFSFQICKFICSVYNSYMTHICNIPSLRKTAKNGPCAK